MKDTTIFASAMTAFIIGASTSLATGFAAGDGKLNWPAVVLIIFGGLATAAKDYRSLMKLPPVETNGKPTKENE